MAPDSDQKFRRPESVLVVVYTTDEQTLLLKRKHPGSFWQSVTGSMEWSGESRIQTAVRELREETGIEADFGALRDWNRIFQYPIPAALRHRYSDSVRFNREHVFSIRLPGIRPVTLQPAEHSEFFWVDIRAAQNIVWSWSNREALEMVKLAEFRQSPEDHSI